MSGPFGSSQWMYQSARDFYEFPIEQSLKFNDDDSSYLSWTPASAGNRKTWTWSGWVKRGNLTGNQRLFAAGANTNNTTDVSFGNGDLLQIRNRISSTNTYRRQTSMEFRDPSAWYHIVVAFDTTQSTADDRIKLYVNGSQVTSWSIDTIGSQNEDTFVSNATPHYIGVNADASAPDLDAYLAEVNFIDGQALDPTNFGEFKSGVWIPKDPSGLTYGTNGFRLSFQNDTVSEGFNTLTYTGTGSNRSLNGLGFSPDLVWIKSRSDIDNHYLQDSVRGATKQLNSDRTDAETSFTNGVTSFDNDGFSLGSSQWSNESGQTRVAWCWDAGSGSPVSNTDGSITSTVKANAAYGMSIISYTGNGTGGATIGHGLGSAPDMIIVKNRTDGTQNWRVQHSALGPTQGLSLNATDAAATAVYWDDTAPTSSVFSVDGSAKVNASGNNYIAYCFADVAGYSKAGSYSGSGSAGNAVTTGFKPAFLMIKRTDSANDWIMFDGTRNTSDPRVSRLRANSSVTEADFSVGIDFTDTGFEVNDLATSLNASGGTYIYLAFADTRDNAFWRDQSGNGNDWQPNNLTYQDSLPDSTTNNWCVMNPLKAPNAGSYAEGNLQVVTGTSSGSAKFSTFEVTSGKWYWEVTPTSNGSNGYIGINTTGTSWVYRADGQKTTGGTDTAYGATYTTNDIIGVALDMDAGTLAFYKNGVSQGTAFTGITAQVRAYVDTLAWGSGAVTYVINFGQDSSFAGNKPAQGNTDDNGVGDFYYAPPSGYLALCTANLPDPVIDPAQDDVPSDYMDTVLYTGTGSSQAITGLTFQPDLVWTKGRSDAFDNNLYDAVRGAYKRLQSNTTSAEVTYSGVTSFNSDGFTVEQNQVNNSGTTYVGWSWLAGNGTSSNTSGSISSTVSVNQKAGFSVVGYTGNGTSGATVGHGLSVAPELLIIKNRDAATNWRVYTTAIDGTMDSLFLNDTSAKVDSSSPVPTSTVFELGTNSDQNASGNDYVCYAFNSVEGYSKFGSYTGNGSTDGPFVYTGFRPSLFLTKRTDSTSDWQLLDTTRDTYNAADAYLKPNTSGAEATGGPHDFVSNGFKIRNTGASQNASGGTYIFMAFAENPFKYANAR